MKRLIPIFFFCLLALNIQGQTNKKIRSLQAQRTELQKQIAESEKILKSMKKDVKSQMNDLAVINGQMAHQEKYITAIEEDVKLLDEEIATVQADLDSLESDLKKTQDSYAKSVQYAYKRNHSIHDKLMFIFSAETVTQMFRRMRYVKEYTSYLKVQGDHIKDQQKQILQWQADVLAAKGEKSNLLRQSEQEKKNLANKQAEQQKLLASLQKKQKDVQKEINQKQKKSENLNAQIDRLVEQEIAAAKKREEERRRKELARQEAERKKKAAQSQSTTKKETASASISKTSSGKNTASKSKISSLSSAGTVASNKTTAPVESMDRYKIDEEDRLVSGGFERNKGLMPVPITGPYVIVSHYGLHNVAGLKNVQLDNKGMDLKGQSGAQARSIFQGEVSSIFSYGGLQNVLIRHGSYISVYCNLQSVGVRVGQKVKARDVIGRVGKNSDGDYVLHFQLRKETKKLNPEAWVGRR